MAFGLPSLLNPLPSTLALPTLATSDSARAKSQAAPPVYGLSLAGDTDLLLEPDSIVSVEFNNDSRVSTAPMEKGAFQSYNKVETPYDLRVTMTKGGGADVRGTFLAECESVAKSLDLYDVQTPEKTYLSCNIVRISHRHSAHQGATLLTVEFILTEIRETGGSQFSTSAPVDVNAPTQAPVAPVKAPKAISGADPKVTGTQFVGPPTQTQVQAVADGLATNPMFISPESIAGF